MIRRRKPVKKRTQRPNDPYPWGKMGGFMPDPPEDCHRNNLVRSDGRLYADYAVCRYYCEHKCRRYKEHRHALIRYNKTFREHPKREDRPL